MSRAQPYDRAVQKMIKLNITAVYEKRVKIRTARHSDVSLDVKTQIVAVGDKSYRQAPSACAPE
jgi:hypothetical protein